MSAQWLFWGEEELIKDASPEESFVISVIIFGLYFSVKLKSGWFRIEAWVSASRAVCSQDVVSA